MSPVTTRASLGFHSSGCDPAGVQSLPLLIPLEKILAGLRSRKFTQGKNNEKWQSVTAGSIGVVVRYRGDCGRCATLTFKFTTVRVPGALNTSVEGINNAGVIAGQYQAGKGITRGFVRDGNKLTRIDHPNGSNTVCRNINSSGVIVGNYADSSGTIRGVLYQSGSFTDIPGPAGATSSAANGINDNGLVVGSYSDSKGVVHGFLLKKKYKTLDVPGATATVASGINIKGDIVLY
jgi:uncharacterized membrane protein